MRKIGLIATLVAAFGSHGGYHFPVKDDKPSEEIQQRKIKMAEEKRLRKRSLRRGRL